MNRSLQLAAVVFGATAAGLLGASPAQATVTTGTVNVVNSPDDTVSGAPWARDTFGRVTSVQPIEGGWTVTIWDSGTFKTPAGVKGSIDGTGTWTITGGTQEPTSGTPSGTIDRTSVALKDSFTGDWWKNFIDGGEVESFSWKWSYKSTCWDPEFREVRTESSASGEKGDRPSKVCPQLPKGVPPRSSHTPIPPGHPTKPTPSASTSGTAVPPGHPSSTTPSASATSTVTPTTTPSSSSPAGAVFTNMPTKNSADTSALPLTGPSVGLFVALGAAVLVTGALLTGLVRRRKMNFTA